MRRQAQALTSGQTVRSTVHGGRNGVERTHIKRGRGRRVCLILAVLLLLGGLATQSASAQEVIVNPGVKEHSLSRNALRAIFGMRLRTWEDGSPITVFVMDDRSPLHMSFAKRQLGIFPHQLRQAWDRLVYSGTGQAPVPVDSEEEMRAQVASTVGGIGYLTSELINESVPVLQIR